MRIFVLILLIVISLNTAKSQLQGQAKIDSLLKELPKMKEDTNGVNLLNNIGFEYNNLKLRNAVEFANLGLELSQKIDWMNGYAKSYQILGRAYYIQADYQNAITNFLKSLNFYDKLNHKYEIAHTNYLMGKVYLHSKQYDKHLEILFRTLEIFQELSEKEKIAKTLQEIGVVYSYKNENEKSLQYYQQALNLFTELNNKSGLAITLGNMSLIYGSFCDYGIALELINKSLLLFRETNEVVLNHVTLGNKGELYLHQTMDSIIEKCPNKNELIRDREYNLKNAITCLKTSIDSLEFYGEIQYQSIFLNLLSEAYLLNNDYKNAYSTLKKSIILNDSIFSVAKSKEIANLEAKRENELKDAEIVILQTEKKAQKYLFGSGIIISLILFVIAFIRFREKKRLSDKLSIQKDEIERQKEIVETQKSIVEEKNEQIVASITYASTIQHAILPWGATLSKAFREHFIFFKPKDIVSGDSYWFQEVDGIKFLAVIDCTGHGIPGSMLTVIASSVLDDAVLSKKLHDTAQILTFMNDKVTEVLNQRLEENQIRDGMEVALIAIHQDKIQFSGAGRPLYMKNGTFEIIKTDKRGIAGQVENDVYDFSSVEIEKSENITLYLTTDGFADQMNEDGKKYSTKRFVSLLESISEKPIPEQNIILETEFNSHKGSREQIDDVTVLGVKI